MALFSFRRADGTSGHKPVTEAPAVLGRLEKSELYDMVEASLMLAQQRLSVYRTTPTNDRAGILAILQEDVTTAAMGTAELLSRYLDSPSS